MLRQFCIAALAATALLGAAPASAAPMKDGVVEGWEYGVFNSGDGCYAARLVTDDVMIGFHWMPATKEFRIAFSNAKWDSLEPIVDKDVPITLRLAGTGRGVTLERSDAAVLQIQGNVEAVVGVWNGADAAGAQIAFSGAKSVSLAVQGKDYGTYQLAGLPSALVALKACGDSIGT